MNKENVKKPTLNKSDLLSHCDTLEGVAQVLELLEYLDLSEAVTKHAEFGLFLVLDDLITKITRVKEDLQALHRAKHV